MKEKKKKNQLCCLWAAKSESSVLFVVFYAANYVRKVLVLLQGSHRFDLQPQECLVQRKPQEHFTHFFIFFFFLTAVQHVVSLLKQFLFPQILIVYRNVFV